ncbi:MAG: hypothetical protein JW762_06515 [Dehalococcoidales bacterium]|nr:hypothetical protein [Dehalococcoidales bacterium]
MRQLPTLIGLAILILVSGLWIGCSQSPESSDAIPKDNPNWSEAQVIEYLYAYVIKKAEQFGGYEGVVLTMRLDYHFINAVHVANIETIREATRLPLEKTSLEFCSLVYVDSLKRLAAYTGGGYWMITTEDSKWLINERTGEVKGENEAAKQILRDIARNSYYDVIHKYDIVFPAGWKVVRLGEDKVAFFDYESSELTGISIAAKVYKLKAGETLGQYASVIASLTGLGGVAVKDYQLNSLIKLENGDYQADYEYEGEGIQIRGSEYFKLHNRWVYMISYRAPKSMYEYWLPEFNYSYKSFSFRPITE